MEQARIDGIVVPVSVNYNSELVYGRYTMYVSLQFRGISTFENENPIKELTIETKLTDGLVEVSRAINRNARFRLMLVEIPQQ